MTGWMATPRTTRLRAVRAPTCSTATAAGVTVNLATGQAAGGHAQGDTLSSIENLIGGIYADVLTGDTGANRLQGGYGNDILAGGAGHDLLEGGDSDDVLVGGDGNDVLLGGSGADILQGGAGADVLNGSQSSNDTASYADSTAVTVSLKTGNAVGGFAAGDTFIDIENLIGSSYADFLKGDDGSNRLEGGAGDDIIEGGKGSDVLIGGAGNDTVRYGFSDAGVTVNLLTGVGKAGFGNSDSLSGIENLIGSQHADHLRGDNGNNRLAGGGGADTLQGDAGNDVLIGGAGNDILRGGASGDVLNGGAGTDTASYDDASAVTVSLETGNVAGSFAVGDTFVSIENLIGSAYADFLKGDAGANRLDGGAGDDLLEGGAGVDVLVGGMGSDTARYAGSGAGVTISLLTGNTAGGHAAGDTLISIENLFGSSYADFLKGDAGANRLEGKAGNDRLEGEAGNDRLEGGDGNDVLIGGAGDDRFIFADGFGNDTVTDFVAGAGTDDRLDFSDHSILNGYATVMAAASQQGADTVIDIGSDRIKLIGVTRTDLHQDDFVF